VDRVVRGLMAVVAVVQGILAVGFVVGAPAATSLFPFEGMTPLSYTFVGSIYLAAAASTGWCLFERSDRAIAGIALDYLAILVPFLAIAAARVAGGGPTEIAAFAGACIVGIVLGLLLLRWALSKPWRTARPTPGPVRWSFAVFVVALVIVGGALVLQVPNVMPWTLTPELSTLFGFMFLGAAAYFAFGLVEPRWENAGGQLAGFLAYDVVLIVPFLTRIPTIDDALRLNLLVYTAVVIYSGLLAAWYLLADRGTRLGSVRAAVDDRTG
jgi:hypothetical protein